MPPARRYGHVEHSSLICAMNNNRTLVLCQDLAGTSWLLNLYVEAYVNGSNAESAKIIIA